MAGTHTLERYRSQLLIQWRSFDVDVELAFAPGDTGVLVAHGDQGGGYALYVDDGDELVFVHNGYGVMTEVRGGHRARRRATDPAGRRPRPAAGRGTSASRSTARREAATRGW